MYMSLVVHTGCRGSGDSGIDAASTPSGAKARKRMFPGSINDKLRKLELSEALIVQTDRPLSTLDRLSVCLDRLEATHERARTSDANGYQATIRQSCGKTRFSLAFGQRIFEAAGHIGYRFAERQRSSDAPKRLASFIHANTAYATPRHDVSASVPRCQDHCGSVHIINTRLLYSHPARASD
jgi:hypothetical protein